MRRPAAPRPGAGAGGLRAAFFFLPAGSCLGRSSPTPQSDQATALFGSFSMGLTGYLGIAATIVVIALLTTLTARFTVMRTIHEIDLIRSDPSRTDQLPDS